MEKTNDKKKNLFLEILRFVVVGGGATIIDFCCDLLIVSLLGGVIGSGWAHAIGVTVGFLVSTVFNYFLSVIWVFQNVKDKKKSKSKKSALIFLVLSAIGLGIGIGLQEIGQVVCHNSFGIDISSIKISSLFSESWTAFWAFCVVFVIKTCVTMVYNYLSRKLVLFKAPKDDTEVEPKEKEN